MSIVTFDTILLKDIHQTRVIVVDDLKCSEWATSRYIKRQSPKTKWVIVDIRTYTSSQIIQEYLKSVVLFLPERQWFDEKFDVYDIIEMFRPLDFYGSDISELVIYSKKQFSMIDLDYVDSFQDGSYYIDYMMRVDIPCSKMVLSRRRRKIRH